MSSTTLTARPEKEVTSMYAIMTTGGKQYSVKVGDIVRVEKLDAELNSVVNFDVLYINDEGAV